MILHHLHCPWRWCPLPAAGGANRSRYSHNRLPYGGPYLPPTITERQRDKGREIGQIRDTQERNTDTQIEEDSRAGQGRSG